MAQQLIVGLMSGTSADGIDAALVAFDAHGGPQLLASQSQPHDAQTKQLIETVIAADNADLQQCMVLDQRLGEAFAQAALNVIGDRHRTQITAIGCHGQTVLHRPERGFSVQLGNGALIAERTGIDTITDFRAADLAAGGQGAPLAPAFHANVFAHPTRHRAIVNIGGISNVTILPAGNTAHVIGFDTGPGNTLLDLWCRQHTGQGYDADGAGALAGNIDTQLLHRCLEDDYFKLPAPKSTGREYFNDDWLHNKLAPGRPLAVNDILATLTALTADTIADALTSSMELIDAVYVCGGGARNRAIMERLADNLQCTVEATDVLGVGADDVEAIAFAWLAWAMLASRPGNLPSVTGARKPKLLGCRWPA